jgi:Flp pilus assembly pilin Flp
MPSDLSVFSIDTQPVSVLTVHSQELKTMLSFEARGKNMRQLINIVLKMKIWKDNRGQDLIEYALMAGFVAVAAGAIMPGVASSINVIFSQVNSIMITAASS